jgi:uncharacterized protein YdhG (YjbR/CyaY superfamily)
MTTDKPNTIDDYIAGFPREVQEKLQQIRQVIKKVAPEAQETIKYAMPTFTLQGNLVYFAGFKNHIGFYGIPNGNAALQKELSAYKQGKGSIQFPLDQPMPLDLIARMVTFRAEGNLEKVAKTRTQKP